MIKEVKNQFIEKEFSVGSFRGSTNLKGPGTQIGWTSELIEEFIKCSKDPIYFGQKYMKIVSVDKGLIPIKMYEYQKELVLSVKNNRSTIAECARQSGKTTALTIIILWYIIFNEHKNVAILANKAEVAREILSRIKLAYEHLPNWLQHGIVEWNKGHILLENGCRVMATATSSSNIRGFSVNLLFIDEAAFIEDWYEFFRSVYPTISSGKTSKLVLVSTVNGLNHFHKITSQARKKKNDFNLISVSWEDVPGRDEEWKQKTLADMGFDYEAFAQEYCNEYLGSSNTLIAGSKLKSLVSGVKLPNLDRAGIKLYQEYIPGHTYVLVADVARGKGLDYSAFIIIDVTEMPYKQVLVFKDNFIAPADFAEIINRFGKKYDNAAVLVEVNDIGQQVGDMLYNDFEYENLLFTNVKGSRGDRVITQGFKPNTDKGIRTTKTVKNIGCSILKLLIEQEQLIIKDHDTIYELSTFSRKKSSYEAETGKHDDLVMCLVLFAWLSDQHYFQMITDIHTLLKLREKTAEEMKNDLMPFGFSDTGMDERESVEHAIELYKSNDEHWFLVE